MYVRLKSYETNTLGDHVMPYRCVHCGYAVTARAFAYGSGTGISPYDLDDDGAQVRAERNAQSAAARQAALSIRIAPCPRCHRRNRRAIVQVYRETLVVCAAIIAGSILLIRLANERWSDAVIVGLMFGPVCAMLFWKHKTSQLNSRQVRFDDPPAAETPADTTEPSR